jgi:uncharacterized protein (TIGR03000 family)
MYSVVLMAALTTGSTAPDCHFRGGGCCGCCGCYGGGWGGYGGWGFGDAYGMGYGGFGPPRYTGTAAPADTTTTPSEEKLKQPTPDKDKEKDKEKDKDKDKDKNKDKDKDKETKISSRAKLIVELPPDAKLYIGGLLMSKTSDVRSFNTPVLKRGQSFYYMVRAEVIRDGKPVTQTRRVIVRAGQTVRANFKDMDTEAVSTARAK